MLPNLQTAQEAAYELPCADVIMVGAERFRHICG